MYKIPFTNLYQQYLDCKDDIDNAIKRTIETSSFITGPDVEKFERSMADYTQSQYCASTGSGTTGLFCSLRALDIGPGDEVITTPHTFVATTEAIVAVGATPVFVDIDPDTHLIDLVQVKTAINSNTKAVLFVDIYGQCPDLDELRNLCNSYKLYMIEDAAHALGTTWKGKIVGGISDLTCFSFNPVKNLGAMGDAGMVTSNRRDLIERVKIYRDHGRTGRYNYDTIGYNARIDNIQANIILAKLPKLKQWIARKQEIAEFYDHYLKDLVKTISVDDRCGHGHYVYVIQTPERDNLQKYLDSRGIGTNIHYATLTSQQPAYAKYLRADNALPTANRIIKEILSLPSWPQLTDGQVEDVITVIREYF